MHPALHKAIILAGGKGSRLQAEARNRPKCLTPIAGKPVLQWQLEWCARWGLHDVTLYIAQMGDQVREFVEIHRNLWTNLKFRFFEEPFPAGTAGGLALDDQRPREAFVLIYGDVIFNIHLPRLFHFHLEKKADATLVVHPNDHPFDSDVLEMDEEGWITKVFPKPHDPSSLPRRNLVNAALYVLTPAVYPFIPVGVPSDFGRDILPHLVSRLRVAGYNTIEYIKDMGTPERLHQVEADVQSGVLEKATYSVFRPAVFLDRDGTINPEKGFLTRWQDFELLPSTAEAVRHLNRRHWPVVVVTNQSGLARNLLSREELRLIHNRMDVLLGERGAWIDDLLYCPHHPDAGYPEENRDLKIPCSCRKPAPGMILQAAERHQLNLLASWMIGDSRRDIDAGRAAGCSTIGVRTGVGCRDAVWPPDIFCNTLAEAVSFLCDDRYWHHVEALAKNLSGCKGILIFGHPASGKSTLAGALHHVLKKRGLPVMRLWLDFWIAPIRNRPQDVSGRLGIARLLEDLHLLLEGKAVKIFPYMSASREASEESIEIQAPPHTFWIVEGVAAGHPALQDLAESQGWRRLKCHTTPEIRNRRIQEFYTWKGLSALEIQKILNDRLPFEEATLDMWCPDSVELWTEAYGNNPAETAQN
ncbi:MAG: HAD-IIIA family hydrolase [Flavobacteriales bacterium]|nr:HAD-IIIA family hydrolase [Flavobacteriales bacterium]MCX7649280.1 HAD-IIIA family hydrolase [Flavobacteriales bacterium]MDW8431898.1 HAD-IIIA family hydrolase [Flavobacteriales bacterium]